MREYKSHLDRLELKFGKNALNSITRNDLKAWIKKIGVKGRTKTNYITTYRTFFAYWVREGEIQKNPAKLIRKEKIKLKSPAILSIEEIQSFIKYIVKHEPRLIAPTALQLFAGLRTSELAQLLWSDVYMESRQIRIRIEISKKYKPRERAAFPPLLPPLGVKTFEATCPAIKLGVDLGS